ncbi:MAG: MBOAT family O-acyltransferase [Chitinophagales bacterium]
MVFNSSIFAVFLFVVFFLYWFVFQKTLRRRNFFLLVVSYIFYGWWDWRFLSLLFLTSSIDYITGFYLDRTQKQQARKYLLAVSLVTNLGVLAVFKYYDFFVTSFVDAVESIGLNLHTETLHIILPVGISFYTFQSLGYSIDVYRKNLKASNDIIAFLAFVSFFPQLVAGPIERAKQLLPQFIEKKTFDYAYAVSGLRLMLWGFFKKIVIADNAAIFVDKVYSSPEAFAGHNILIATFLFAIQIYCDFSGYSDIAIGCARLFGFDIMKNFNDPYFALSPKEFWRRWHISLSTWFRDYVYIPLGGNKNGDNKTIANLFLTFLLSGLWHGPNFTFIAWGALHGTAVSVQTFFEQRKVHFNVSKYVSGMFTFLFVCFCWIFFRAENLSDAGTLLKNIFDGQHAEKTKLFQSAGACIVLCQSLALFVVLEVGIRNKRLQKKFFAFKKPLRWAIYYLLVFYIIFFGAFDNPPSFIYFQF